MEASEEEHSAEIAGRRFAWRSLGVGPPLTIGAMASDLESLLALLEIERGAVVGWSMGGYVAQALAARAPDRIEAMVPLATAPGGSTAVSVDPQSWGGGSQTTAGTQREQASRLIVESLS